MGQPGPEAGQKLHPEGIFHQANYRDHTNRPIPHFQNWGKQRQQPPSSLPKPHQILHHNTWSHTHLYSRTCTSCWEHAPMGPSDPGSIPVAVTWFKSLQSLQLLQMGHGPSLSGDAHSLSPGTSPWALCDPRSYIQIPILIHLEWKFSHPGRVRNRQRDCWSRTGETSVPVLFVWPVPFINYSSILPCLFTPDHLSYSLFPPFFPSLRIHDKSRAILRWSSFASHNTQAVTFPIVLQVLYCCLDRFLNWIRAEDLLGQPWEGSVPSCESLIVVSLWRCTPLKLWACNGYHVMSLEIPGQGIAWASPPTTVSLGSFVGIKTSFSNMTQQ